MSVKHRNAKLRREIGEYRKFVGTSKDYLTEKAFQEKFAEALKWHDEWLKTVLSCRYGVALLKKYCADRIEDKEQRNKIFGVRIKAVPESLMKL